MSVQLQLIKNNQQQNSIVDSIALFKWKYICIANFIQIYPEEFRRPHTFNKLVNAICMEYSSTVFKFSYGQF